MRLTIIILLIAIFYAVFGISVSTTPTDVYRAIPITTFNSSSYHWMDIIPHVLNNESHQSVQNILDKYLPKLSTAEFFSAGKKVLVSLTVISSRLQSVYQTIISLLCGQASPTLIYLFISSSPFLLDAGIPIENIPQTLLALAATGQLRIVYVENIGPHRKLLPLLEKEYDSDQSIIINIDDDLGVMESSAIVYQLMKVHYQNAKKGEYAVVSTRARRIGACNQYPYHVTRYFSWMVQPNNHNKREMLLLPTGTGGILYLPSMFHPVVFNEKFRLLTKTADDIMFRLSTMIKNISVSTACTPRMHSSGRVIKSCSSNSIDKEFSTTYSTLRTCSSLELALRLRDFLQDQKSSYPLNEKIDEYDVSEENLTEDTVKSTNLFSINRKGHNDNAWRASVQFLQDRSLIRYSQIANDYLPERGSMCLQNDTSNRISRYCAMWPCKIK